MGAHRGRPVWFILVRVGHLCAVFLCVALASLPISALAAGWPLAEDSVVLLGYGQVYAGADGATHTHSGLDIAAPAGVPILGLVDGTVTFAGRIPAGVGASTLAVTVEGTADGLRYTIMPLEALDVTRGDVLSIGDPLGSLAATGDGSSEVPHVHVSVRRGDTYLDPIAVLTRPAALAEEPEPANDEAQPVAEEPGASVSAPRAVPSPTAAPEGAHVSATAAQADPKPGVSGAGGASAPLTTPGDASAGWSAQDAAGVTDSGATLAGEVDAGAPVSRAADTKESRIAAGDPLACMDAGYATVGPVGKEIAGSGRVPTGRGLPRSVVLLGGLPALAALWPLLRRERPVFASCVRARGDDVAAVVGR
jgi:hypothetical protein